MSGMSLPVFNVRYKFTCFICQAFVSFCTFFLMSGMILPCSWCQVWYYLLTDVRHGLYVCQVWINLLFISSMILLVLYVRYNFTCFFVCFFLSQIRFYLSECQAWINLLFMSGMSLPFSWCQDRCDFTLLLMSGMVLPFYWFQVWIIFMSGMS